MYGNGNMVDWLLANGADRNITNADGALPIHVAAESGNVDMLKLTISDGQTNVSVISPVEFEVIKCPPKSKVTVPSLAVISKFK